MAHNVDALQSDLRRSLDEILGGHDSFRDALGFDDDQVHALTEYANTLADQGQNAHAKALLEGLVVLEPKNSHLHTCLGIVYLNLGEHEAAYGELGYAVELDPEDIAAWAYLGEACFERDQLDAATLALAKAIDLDPDKTDPFGDHARNLSTLVAFAAREVERHGPEALQLMRARRAAGVAAAKRKAAPILALPKPTIYRRRRPGFDRFFRRAAR